MISSLSDGELESDGHAKHCVRSSESYVRPGQVLHVPLLVALTEVELFPASHKVQGSDPLAGLYLPATQAVHGPPSGPVYPGLQVQSVILSLV